MHAFDTLSYRHTVLQVPFMHMAKGIVGRWTSRLWQQCLTLDAADRLRAEAQGVPRDTSGCAADVDEDQEEPATLDDVAAAVSGNMQDFFLSDKVHYNIAPRIGVTVAAVLMILHF